MLVADTLSCYAPLNAPEIPLDITINHVHITPDNKSEFQAIIQDDPFLCSLAKVIITGLPEDINDVPHALCLYHGHQNVLTIEDGFILCVKALIIPPSERQKILHAIHMGIWASPSVITLPDTVGIGLVLMQTSDESMNHVPLANVTTHRNHDICSSQLQLQSAHGNTLVLITSTLMAQST